MNTRRVMQVNGRRRGHALLLVIGLVAVVSVLGAAYLADTALTVQSSCNLVQSGRARYVAESGVEHALVWLGVKNPPGANAQGYWPGTARQMMNDGTSDWYAVTVTRDASDASRYQVVSVGYAVGGGSDGTLAHKVTAWVKADESSNLQIPYALHAERVSTLRSNQTFVGNVHCNAILISTAANIQGNLTGCGLVSWSVKPSGSVKSWQPAYVFPSLTCQLYRSYSLNGVACAAINYNSSDLTSDFYRDDPSGRRSPTWNVTSTNPGGVVNVTRAHGQLNFAINSNVNFTGTLLVDGDVILSGDDVTLTAQAGFPALVVTGDLILKDRNNDQVINGAVIVGGTVSTSGNVSGTKLTINGPLHVGGGLTMNSWSSGTFTVDRKSERAWLYDFASNASAIRLTVQSWQDF